MGKPLEIDEFMLNRIAKSVNGLEYGSVHILVHDGKIVQIERTEKNRFGTEAGVVKQSRANEGKNTKGLR